jgi:hypothetical protein
MRNGQNKRMRGRNRNKGHHGHHHQNPLTRVYESNGPDVKIRGTAQHIAEKYMQLARDAMASGDPITAENHHQHAEHYLRLIATAQEQFRQQNPYYQPPAAPGDANRDDFDEGDDDGQPMQQGFGQPNFQQPQQQQPYPSREQQQYPQREQQQYAPREQPQPYGGQPQYQPRPQQHQPYQPPQQFQPQPYQPQPQQPQPQSMPAPQAQPPVEASDGERLPSFITGSPPQNPQNFAQNGFDAPDRFPRHRRRRHRGPRPDVAGGAPREFRGEDGPDDSRPV